LNPGSAGTFGTPASTIVSPTGAALISRMAAIKKPTSPALSSWRSDERGVNTPTFSTVHLRCVECTTMRASLRITPFMTRTSETTPA
jgi:hypothetical protein